jgi:hypothetical protein
MEFKNDLDASFIALPHTVASGSVDYRAYKPSVSCVSDMVRNQIYLLTIS